MGWKTRVSKNKNSDSESSNNGNVQSLIENNTNINIDSIIDKYKLYIYNYLGVTSNKYEIFITNGYRSYNLIYNLIPLYYNTTIHIIISNTEETISSNYYKTIFKQTHVVQIIIIFIK